MIRNGVSSAVTFTVQHHLADVFAVNVIPVKVHLACQGSPGDFSFPFNALFTGRKAVRNCADSRTIHTHVEVPGALGNVGTFLHRPLAQQVADELRLIFVLIMEMEKNASRCRVHSTFKVFGKLLPEHLRARGSFLCLLHHLRIGNFKYFCRVDFHKIVQGIFHAGDAHPVAACSKAFSCEVPVISEAHKAVDKAVVSRISRPGIFILEQIPDALPEKVFIHVVMHTDSQVAGNVDPVSCFENQIADVGGHIISVVIRAGKLVIARVVQEKAGNIKLRCLIVDDACCNIMLVKRPQEFIQLAAGGSAVIKPAEEAEPAHPLDALPQSFRLPFRYFFVAGRHLRQVLLQIGILLLFGKLSDLLCHAVQESNDMLHDHDLTLIEFRMLRAGIDLLILFQLFKDAAPAHGKSHPQIGRKMPVRADAADDIILFKRSLQVVIGDIRIPDCSLLPCHEEEAAADEGIQRVAVKRVLIQHFAVVRAPAFIAVKASVFVVGNKLKMEIIRRNNAPVIVLIQAAFHLDLLLRLLQLARFEQADPLIQRKFLIG